jgi:anti-sigma factor RsiW
MYDCKTTIPLIGLYADNELESLATSKVAEHLERCALCRRELEIIQTQKRLLAESVRNTKYDTTALRASIEAATIRRAPFSFRSLHLSRAKAWGMSATVILLASVAFLYFSGLVGNVRANSLYEAAARDHTVCSRASEGSEWAQSSSAIAQKAKAFLQMEVNLPRSVGTDYVLVRARLCQLNGKTFLHVVYETRDGRKASLFLCPNTTHVPAGERSLIVDARAVELARVSQLTVNGSLKGSCLLVAVADDETVATALLLNAVTA